MSYATQQDLIDRFGAVELAQLTDRTNRPPSVIDGIVVGRALADAAGLIGGYLSKVYDLPLASVPANLVKAQADIARYYLHGKATEKDGHVATAYRDAVAWLRDVSQGKVRLDDGAAAPEPAPGSAGRVSAGTPVLTRDALRGF